MRVEGFFAFMFKLPACSRTPCSAGEHACGMRAWAFVFQGACLFSDALFCWSACWLGALKLVLRSSVSPLPKPSHAAAAALPAGLFSDALFCR